MTYTEEQQFQLDLENVRASNSVELETRRVKIETLRMARDVLIENNRSKPVDAREVTSQDIIAYATALAAYCAS